MSLRESPITEAFWRQVTGGLYCPEYALVKRGPRNAPRWADAIILPDEPTRLAARSEYPPLNGRQVIAIQTKDSRLGMYLLGQAVFTASLCYRLGASAVRSVALCTKADDVLTALLIEHPAVEAWVWDGAKFDRQIVAESAVNDHRGGS